MATSRQKSQNQSFAPLFSPGDAQDTAYLNLRGNSTTPEAIAGRKFAEELWREYSPFADDNFLVEIRNNFHARFWEMYLTCALRQQSERCGYTISCPKPGPDVLLQHKSQRIWIEAVTATDGDSEKSDSPIDQVPGSGSTIPDEKIILRYANAIMEKHKKYQKYLEDGTIAEIDSYIIAINGYPLSLRWTDAEVPRILKSVFPLGNLEIVFDRNTKEILDSRHQFRPLVHKANLAAIPTDIFLRDEFQGISAILHSYAYACMTVRPLGIDFVVVHNPKTSRRVPLGLIPAGREYHATPTDDGYEIECHENIQKLES